MIKNDRSLPCIHFTPRPYRQLALQRFCRRQGQCPGGLLLSYRSLAESYGVGIAIVETTADGKVSFSKFYYGPEYEGGGHGMETCIKQ